jgi:murein endopeptidase
LKYKKLINQIGKERKKMSKVLQTNGHDLVFNIRLYAGRQNAKERTAHSHPLDVPKNGCTEISMQDYMRKK